MIFLIIVVVYEHPKMEYVYILDLPYIVLSDLHIDVAKAPQGFYE